MMACGKDNGFCLIVFVASLNKGGAEVVLFGLLRKLISSGASVRVFTVLPGGEMENDFLEEGIEVRRIDLNGVIELRRFAAGKGNCNGEPQVFFQGWMYHGCLFASLAKLLFAWKVPVYWSIHHSSFDKKVNSRITLKLISFLGFLSHIALVRKISFCGPLSRYVHIKEKRFKKAKAIVIPNGVDFSRFHPSDERRLQSRKQLLLDKTDLLLGLFASWQPIKGFEVFFEGARLLAEENQNFKFLLCGRGTEQENNEIVNLAKDKGVLNRCIFMGVRSDVPNLMNACDALAITSWGESLPMVLLEGIGSGVPCFSSDVGDCGFVLRRAERLFPRGDAKTFSECLLKFFAKSKDVQIKEILADRERVMREFSIEKMAESFQRLYRIHSI